MAEHPLSKTGEEVVWTVGRLLDVDYRVAWQAEKRITTPRRGGAVGMRQAMPQDFAVHRFR